MLVALATVSVAISSPVKGEEICHLGLWKGPKGLTDECYGFYGFDSYLKDSEFTAVKRNPKF